MPYRHAHPISRWLRVIGYSAFSGAGVFVVFLDIFAIYYKTVGVFCVVGGLLSLYGALSKRWPGEFLGLPLLASAMLAFAAITYRDAWPTSRWIAAPSILILLAYGALLTARWLDVAAVSKAARRHAIAERRQTREPY